MNLCHRLRPARPGDYNDCLAGGLWYVLSKKRGAPLAVGGEDPNGRCAAYLAVFRSRRQAERHARQQRRRTGNSSACFVAEHDLGWLLGQWEEWDGDGLAYHSHDGVALLPLDECQEWSATRDLARKATVKLLAMNPNLMHAEGEAFERLLASQLRLLDENVGGTWAILARKNGQWGASVFQSLDEAVEAVGDPVKEWVLPVEVGEGKLTLTLDGKTLEIPAEKAA